MVYYYPHPEKFEDFEKPDLKKFDGNIVLWGAGRLGGVAEYCLRKQGINICAFCDIAKDKWGTEFCGHAVISPEQLEEMYPDAAIIISNTFHYTMSSELEKKGYKNVFDCTSLFLEIDFDEYDFWMLPEYAIRNVEQYMSSIHEQIKGANSLDQIYLNITTKCSLRCRDCSVFIPYVKEKCNYDSTTVMKDFYSVLNCLEHIRIVNFYGGEPLLHPELAKMIRMLKDETRIERISIITNGTILPNEELLDVLEHDKRTLIRISDYGELSTKLSAIEEAFSSRKIAYEISNYTYWDSPSVIAPCNDTEEELQRKFQLCTATNCAILLNRKFYRCITASAVNNMGVFPYSESNCVDIGKYEDSEKELKDKLNEYLERPRNKKYFDACRYCSGMYCVHFENKVPVAVQAKEQMEFPKLY